jgi:hypothetical protein
MRLLRIFLVLALTALATPLAHAEDPELAAKLKAKVAEMNGMQQAALLLFLDNLAAGAAAPTPEAAAAETPESAIKASLAKFKDMVANKNFDIEPFFDRISEDFTHPVVRDKEGAVSFLRNLNSSGLAEGALAEVEISLEDAEYEIDGDEAEIYPIDISSPFGSVTLGLIGKNENGVWRVTEVDGL